MPGCYNQCNNQCNNPCYNPCNPCDPRLIEVIKPATPAVSYTTTDTPTADNAGTLTIVAADNDLGTARGQSLAASAATTTNSDNTWNINAFDECGNEWKVGPGVGGGLVMASGDAATASTTTMTGSITGNVSARNTQIYLAVKNIRAADGTNTGPDTQLQVVSSAANFTSTKALISSADKNRWAANTITYSCNGISQPVSIVKFSDLDNQGIHISQNIQDTTTPTGTANYKIGGTKTNADTDGAQADNAALKLTLPKCVGDSCVLTLNTVNGTGTGATQAVQPGLSYLSDSTVPNVYTALTATLVLSISKVSSTEYNITTTVSTANSA